MSGTSSRRRLLSALATMGVLGTGGCLSIGNPLAGDSVPEERIRRGEADVVAEYSRIVESDTVEYVGDGEVEIVVAQSGGEPSRTETEPFEDWAERRCLTAAQAGVWQHITDAIRDDYGVDRRDFRFGRGAEAGAPRANGVIVAYVVTLDHDDSVVDRPAVPFDELVGVTPESATATIEFEGHEHECDGPVWVELLTEYEATLA